MRKALLILGLLLFAAPALADNVKPRPIATYLHNPAPYSQGSVKHLLLNLYDVTLWMDADKWSVNETFALSIVYHIDHPLNEMVSNTLKNMEDLGTLPEHRISGYEYLFNQLYRPVHKGDELVILNRPGIGVTFFFNGKLTGTVSEAIFAEQYFAIWFSPKTKEPDLRKALLKIDS